MPSADTRRLLSELPPTITSVLNALKTFPKLEAAVEAYVSGGFVAKEDLDAAARPILLDAGCGKKGAAAILEKWKAEGATKTESPADQDTASPVQLPSATGAAPRKDLVRLTKSSATKTVTKRKVREKAVDPPRTAPTPAAAEEPLPSTEVAKSSEAPSRALVTLAADLASQLPTIHATSQATRFHVDAIDTETKEIDLKDVTIQVCGRELLTNAHLKIKEGVHYGLHSRNGLGKSTLLRAMADNLIPGLPSSVRILLVSQVETDLMAGVHEQVGSQVGETEPLTVLEAVKGSDRIRVRAENEFEALNRALEVQDSTALRHIVTSVRLKRAQDELEEAQRTVIRRSGTRGSEARKWLLRAEKQIAEAQSEHAGGHCAIDDEDEGWAAQATEMLTQAQTVLEDRDDADTDTRARRILHGLGFSKERIIAPYTSLSGGWRSRVSLAQGLLQPTNLLCLDEPTNFLDLPALLWLQQYIWSIEHSVIVISHDREFLDAVAQELIILRKNTLTYFLGNLSLYEATQWRNYKFALRQQHQLDKKRSKIEKSIAEASKQAKKSGDDNKARMAKSRQRKLDERFGVEVNASGHRFKLNRDFGGYHLTSRGGPEIDAPDRPVSFSFPDTPPLRFPGALVDLDGVSFTHKGAKRATLKGMRLTIGEGERVALVGPNGHGKTTLINLITSKLAPTQGSITFHPKARIGLYAQHTIEDLSAGTSASQTALAHFLAHTSSIGAAADEGSARSFLGQLGLGGRVCDTQLLGTLSGGQKVRLGLAEVLWAAPDLLVLDEVTTHLDGDSILALLSALRAYSGAILLCSHDRFAVRCLVEGKSLRDRAGMDELGEDDEEEDSEEDSSADEAVGLRGGTKAKGRTYLVKDTALTLLPEGMQQYVQSVEDALPS